MKKATKARYRALLATALMAFPVLASAQGYYDDDIYFDARTNPVIVPSQTTSQQRTNVRASSVTVYPGADTYVFTTGCTRDVDDYNRYGRFLVSDTTTLYTDSITDTYSATRRLERFHNPGVVDGLTDDEYAAYVLTQPSVVNIYVDNDPWDYYTPYWRYSVGGPWWGLSWGYYDPWYSPAWNYGWGWPWRPVWGPSWAWTPGWGHTWCPGWGPGWGGPGWGGGVAWRPSTGGGSSRPHNSAVGSGMRGNSVRPVASSSVGRLNGSASSRPGAGGYGNGISSRPGYSTRPGAATAPASTRPGSSGVGTSTGRGRNAGTYTPSGSGSSTRRSSTSTPSRSSSSSSGSYNSGSGSHRSSSSSGSYSSGSRGGGGFSGGGSHSGGGGGGRGRR